MNKKIKLNFKQSLMSNGNQISLSIPPEKVEQVKQLYGQINGIISEYLVNLTPEQSKELPKMGDKSYAFVTKALEYLQVTGTPIPPYTNVAEMVVDMNGYDTIRQILQAAQPTIDMLQDTMLLSGSEAYVAALAYYNYIKGAAKAGVPGAQTIYDDLSARFQVRPSQTNG
jgi:hypothetical protein